MGAPTVMVFVGLTLPTASQPPSLSGTASLVSPERGDVKIAETILTEGSFFIHQYLSISSVILHFAFCILHLKKSPKALFYSTI